MGDIRKKADCLYRRPCPGTARSRSRLNGLCQSRGWLDCLSCYRLSEPVFLVVVVVVVVCIVCEAHGNGDGTENGRKADERR